MKSQYRSSKSVAKNQTVPINVDDPRLAWNKIGQTKARQGAEIDIIGLDGKSLIMGGLTLTNPTGSGTSESGSLARQSLNYLPPMGGEPPKVYPGGSGPFIITPTDPTDVAATWSGEDLVITFNWDYANALNKTISQFIVELTADGVTRRTAMNTFLPNKTQTSQSITVTKAINSLTFGTFRTNITAICVLSGDPLNNISGTVCAGTVPTYVLDLPTPTITVTSANNGYNVAYTAPTSSSYDAIDIWEYESTSSTEPTGVTYSRTYFGRITPAAVITPNNNARWVKARFSSSSGTYTAFSAAQKVTPTSPISVDNTPPNEVTAVTGEWSVDDVVVDYTLPSTDPAARVQIQLTAPNSLVGYFYRFPSGSGTSQTTTITKKDLFDQFGAHYSSFTGVLRSIDSSDNRSSGVSFTVATRPNPLTGVTPTFTTVALSNAYSVNFTLPTGAVYAEVYAKHTAWSGNPVDDTYVVYSGLSPAVVVDTDYTTVYIKIRYYDDFGNTSNFSAEGTITPLNPGEITSFENPISFGTNAVIYAGNSPTEGTRTLFKTGGIFAYDATNTSPSTQIVSDATAGTPTFITTQAQIADWKISSTKIENTLSGTPTKYTGLSASGTYAFWAGSDVSGGNSTAKFSVTPLGVVTAREISIIGNGNSSTNLISAGSLFTVKNDGTLTATSANITGTIYASGGEFTGNVKLNGGSLYALGSGGTVSSGIRTIFNSSGIAAYNSSGGYAQMLTTPLADGSVFATTAANLGGWLVDSSKIQKTSISGKGNITLDSVNGYITVSNSSLTSNLAGINSPGNNLNHSVFWAGGTDPNSTSNPFRVTLGGKVFANEADIKGTISSVGTLGTMTMDGTDGFMSLATASNNNISYLVPRNGNIYLTGPSTTAPWSTGKEIATDGPTNAPYFSAGSSFKDYLNATVNGIGIFTGSWNYFGAANATAANTASSPFVAATTTGVQISANAQVGMIVASSSSGLSPAISNGNPGILFYTSKNSSAPYSPNTSYGAWGAITPETITFSASANNSTNEINAYGGKSQIIINNTKVSVIGIPQAPTFDMDDYRVGTLGAGNYRNLSSLGYPPRQRIVIEDPVTGEAQLGLGVYYLDKTKINGTGPGSNMGVQGDLAVVF